MDYWKNARSMALCANKCYYYNYIYKFRDEDELRSIAQSFQIFIFLIKIHCFNIIQLIIKLLL